MKLTRENTAIVLDSTADFPDAPIRFPNMRVVPLYVRFGDESFRDYVELDPHDFYARLRTAPRAADDVAADAAGLPRRLRRARRLRADLLAPHLRRSSRARSRAPSLAAAERAATGSALVDTESASVGIAMLALAIQELLERGTTDEEIEALVERYRERAGILFTVDTLEFLAKGGRIGRGKALMGSLLNVKPILAIEDGEVVPLTRVRGRAKAFEEFRKRFEEATTDGPGLAVGDRARGRAEDAVEQLQAIVLASRPQAEVEARRRPSAPSSARTPGPARSASSGSRTLTSLAGYASRPAEPASGAASRRSRRSSRRPVPPCFSTGLRTASDAPGTSGRQPDPLQYSDDEPAPARFRRRGPA